MSPVRRNGARRWRWPTCTVEEQQTTDNEHPSEVSRAKQLQGGEKALAVGISTRSALRCAFLPRLQNVVGNFVNVDTVLDLREHHGSDIVAHLIRCSTARRQSAANSCDKRTLPLHELHVCANSSGQV